VCAYLFQNPAMSTVPAKVVLTMDLEPFDWRALLEKLQMVLRTQSNTRAPRFASGRRPLPRGVGEVGRENGASAHTNGRPGGNYFPGVRRPPTRRSQVPLGSLRKSLGLPALVL